MCLGLSCPNGVTSLDVWVLLTVVSEIIGSVQKQNAHWTNTECHWSLHSSAQLIHWHIKLSMAGWATFCQHDFLGSIKKRMSNFACEEHVVGGQCISNFYLIFGIFPKKYIKFDFFVKRDFSGSTNDLNLILRMWWAVDVHLFFFNFLYTQNSVFELTQCAASLQTRQLCWGPQWWQVTLLIFNAVTVSILSSDKSR